MTVNFSSSRTGVTFTRVWFQGNINTKQYAMLNMCSGDHDSASLCLLFPDCMLAYMFFLVLLYTEGRSFLVNMCNHDNASLLYWRRVVP